MKEIILIKKHKVIKLFFSGLSYDEIAVEVGISKGSVVNIIDEFKAGELPIAPDEYIDALRELAVDMRKQHISVKQLKMYDKIHHKLAEMGVGMEQVDDWLDISQDIATESVSAKKFVAAALHLAQLEIETGHDPESLVTEFESKSEALNTLKAEIVETTGFKEKAAAELDSINKAKIAAHEQYDTQTAELKAKLDDFMTQNQLSWDKVNKVLAILEEEFAKEELGEEEIEKVSKLIAKTGLLATCIKSLEEEKETLAEHILQLKEDTYKNEMANIGSQKLFNQLAPQVLTKAEERRTLNSQLKEIRLQLSELKIIKHKHAEDIFTAWLILAFLENQEAVSDYDFDWLVEIMNGIRLVRLGKKPKQAFDAEGKVICECHVPMPYTPVKEYSIAVKEARQRLARYLVPLVEDKFVPRFEYEQAKLTRAIMEMYKQLANALSGHPSTSYQSADQPGPSEQKTAKTTEEEANMNEQSDEAIPVHTDIPEHSEFLEVGLDYGSAAKAKMEMDKKFLASISGRTDNPSLNCLGHMLKV